MQDPLDAFDSRITQQLGRENTLDVATIRVEIANIKNMVTELSKRSVIA